MQKQLNEDFIEEYSEQFTSSVCDKFFANKTHISGQEILNITPSKQVNFFVIKLLFNNWQDESKRLESPFFDYSSNDVKEAMAQFMNVLSRHINVARKEFEILLQDSVRDTLFLIMSPNAFMEIEMDRKGTEKLTEKSAKNISKYLRIAKDEFTKNITSQIGKDRDDLELDETIITNEILENEISLLNEIIPLTLKKLEEGDYGDDISEESSLPDSPEEPDSTKPESVEDEVVIPVAEPAEEQDEEPELDTNYQAEEIKEESPPVEETHDEAEDENNVEVDEEPPSGEIITNLDPDEEDDDDEDAILNSKFEDPMVGSIAEKHESEADTMLNAISLNHRYMFINELFDGEADLFAQAIDKVDKSDSFDQSVEMLVQNYAKDFHWDMNSDEVKELLKIIFRRFR